MSLLPTRARCWNKYILITHKLTTVWAEMLSHKSTTVHVDFYIKQMKQIWFISFHFSFINSGCEAKDSQKSELNHYTSQ